MRERVRSNSFRVTTGLAGGSSLASPKRTQVSHESKKSAIANYGEVVLQRETENVHVKENISLNSFRVTSGLNRGGTLASSRLMQVVINHNAHNPTIFVNDMDKKMLYLSESETTSNIEKTDHLSIFPGNQMVLNMESKNNKLSCEWFI